MPRRRSYITPVNETSIGQRLRDARRRRGLTQAEVAEELGIDQTLVSNYERGVARMHAALVAGFAKVLRVSADEILGLRKPASNGATSGRLLRRIQRIDKLPVADQKAVLKFLEALLEKRGHLAS